ncbi:MAG TPA: amidase [Polyangiaceae bacterium]|nr:amidase [Polyangiaceae bacterium]
MGATSPFIRRSATELASMIRRGEATSAEIVDAHIRHIEAVNPALNAVVKSRFDEARAEAIEADRRAAKDDKDSLGPFHGVPFTVKESFALQGMPNTSGLVARRGTLARSDAPTVARLRRAGAIPLGVTNLSELCMWMESNNRVYGRTNNAYDQRCTAGGSSGGEGAIVGAGGSPFGLGSDIGGSIRMPAFFNGVFGHKPTGGLVDNEGQYPIASGAALRYMTPGPLARRAEDLAPIVRALAGDDAIGDPSEVPIADLTVTVIEGNGAIAVRGDLLTAIHKAARALAARGARVRTARVDSLARSLEIWSSMLHAAGGPSFRELLGNGAPFSMPREIVRWTRGRSPHTFPALALALLEELPALLSSQSGRFIELGKALLTEIQDLLGPCGVLLYPPYPTPAPRHYKPLFPPFNWVYTAIWNVLELPVTQAPLGRGAEGLPLGVQIVGAPGQDGVTIAVAIELEQAFGGWTPPPLAR